MVNDPDRIRYPRLEVKLALFERSQPPRFMNGLPRNPTQLRHPASDEVSTWVVIITLLDRIIHADGIDSGSTGLHLNLRVVYSGLVIEELLSKKISKQSPVEKEVVGSKAYQHRSHTEVEPTSRS
jgi:hypothetical protein